MTKSEIEIAARLEALETLAVATWNLAVINSRLSDSDIAEVEAGLVRNAGQRTIETLDPAMSDHVSAECETALRRLVKSARDNRAVG